MTRNNFFISKENSGQTLQEFLAHQGFPEDQIEHLQNVEGLRLNGRKTDLKAVLSPQDQVSLHWSQRKEKDEIAVPPLLFENEHLQIYDKPSGVAVVEEYGKEQTGLLGLLRKDAQTGPPYLVHRLDKGTSGTWVVAKTLKAKKDLTAQFSDNQVFKQYRAYVQGVLHEKEGTIEAPIGKNLKNQIAMKVDAKGRPAETQYKLVRQFRKFAIVRLWLKTGRTHQVRVHMRHLGHPLMVDGLYGGLGAIYLSNLKPNYKTPASRPEKPLISRLTLHAEMIELRDPDGGAKISVESPLPKDLQRLERNLKNYG